MKTDVFFDSIIQNCKDIFTKKMKDYGASWRILRTSSLTDQIFIKAQRIRTIEEKKTKRVNEDVDQEYMGIINYSIMALIQLKLGYQNIQEVAEKDILSWYEKFAIETKELMLQKNHDYGEAWRDMRIESITDLILMKILRIKQIEDNKGKTIISEGIDANYMDIINYCIFGLYKINVK